MEELSGYSISQFNTVNYQDRIIYGDDRFFTSQLVNPNSAFKEYESKYLTYDTLLTRLFADLSSSFGFGSMAYQLSDDYSAAYHKHGYNSFDAESRYGMSQNTLLATFKINDKIVRLCMPRLWVYKVPDPIVGELKFIALSNITQPDCIDINDSAFDGWVYPRGQTYAVKSEDFKQAKRCFGRSETSVSFTVPNIDRFIRAAPNSRSARRVSFKNEGIPSHSHESNVTVGGSSSITIKARASSQAGDGGKIHNGGDAYNPVKYYEGKLALNATEFTINKCDIGNSEASLNREQYPSYNYLPVMIYIGKKQ